MVREKNSLEIVLRFISWSYEIQLIDTLYIVIFKDMNVAV